MLRGFAQKWFCLNIIKCKLNGIRREDGLFKKFWPKPAFEAAGNQQGYSCVIFSDSEQNDLFSTGEMGCRGWGRPATGWGRTVFSCVKNGPVGGPSGTAGCYVPAEWLPKPGAGAPSFSPTEAACSPQAPVPSRSGSFSIPPRGPPSLP